MISYRIFANIEKKSLCHKSTDNIEWYFRQVLNVERRFFPLLTLFKHRPDDFLRMKPFGNPSASCRNIGGNGR